MTSLPTCDACGKPKVCHLTRAAAEAERNRIISRHPAGYNHSLEVYRCFRCGEYHCGASRRRHRVGRSFRIGTYATATWSIT